MKSESQRTRAKRRLGPWRVFFLALGMLILLGIAATLVSMVRTSRLADAELAKLREGTEPTSFAGLDKYYQLPAGVENTAPLWLEALAVLDGSNYHLDAEGLPIVLGGQARIPPPGEPWADLEKAEGLLEKYQESLDSLHQVARKNGSARYVAGSRFGFGMAVIPSLTSPMSGARLLALQARVRAHRGDPAGAAKALHTIFMLSRSLEEEPMLLPQLVRCASDRISLEQLEVLLGSVDFSDDDLRRLQADLQAAKYKDGLYKAMLGERTFGIEAYENPPSSGAGDLGGRILRLATHGSFNLYLDHMDRLLTATRRSWPETILEAEKAESELRQVIDGNWPLARLKHSMTGRLTPVLATTFARMAQSQGINSAANAAIAVQLCRRKHGNFPTELEELVPEFLPQVPIDPFDGQPLRYRVEDDGYFIYSIGTDHADDGGQEEEGSLEPDVTFRVGPSPKPD